jgi:hypothetical protein
MRSFLLMGILLLCLPAPAPAQNALQALAGRRVRVTTRPVATRVVANAVAVQGDTLVLDAGGFLVHLPIALLSRVEVQRDKSSAALIIGGAVGAIGGAVIGLSLAGTECLRASFLDPCDSTPELGAPLAGGVLGAFLGAAVGKLFQGNRWKNVPLEPPSVGVAWSPAVRGFTVAVRIRIG